MCNAAVLGIGSMAMTAYGGYTQAKAQNQAGKDQQRYYNYMSAQDKMAADAALVRGQKQSEMEQDSGAFEAKSANNKAMELQGSQKAAQAANGIGGGAVTSADIATDTLTKEDLDRQAIRYNADVKSWQAKTGAGYQAWDLNNQANLNTIAGDNARRAGKINSRATMFSTAASLFSQGSKMMSQNSATSVNS